MQHTTVLRTCKSVKLCTECNKQIEINTLYYSGSHCSYHLKCWEKLTGQELAFTAATTQVASTTGDSPSASPDNSHTVLKLCYKCGKPTVGVIYDKGVCALHINDAVGDSV